MPSRRLGFYRLLSRRGGVPPQRRRLHFNGTRAQSVLLNAERRHLCSSYNADVQTGLRISGKDFSAVFEKRPFAVYFDTERHQIRCLRLPRASSWYTIKCYASTKLARKDCVITILCREHETLMSLIAYHKLRYRISPGFSWGRTSAKQHGIPLAQSSACISNRSIVAKNTALREVGGGCG